MALEESLAFPESSEIPDSFGSQGLALDNPARVGGRERQLRRPPYARGPRRLGLKT